MPTLNLFLSVKKARLVPLSLALSLTVSLLGALCWLLIMSHPVLASEPQAGQIWPNAARPYAPLRTEKSRQEGLRWMRLVHDAAHGHSTEKSAIRMVIKDAKGRTRVRYFNLSRLVQGPRTYSLIKFYKPPKVRGTGLLSQSRGGSKSPVQWIFFPSTRLVSALSTGKQKNSFMGSDFSYADIAGRDLEQDTHYLVGETAEFYHIQSVPKNEDAYTRLDITVNKKTYMAARVDFYRHDNASAPVLFKTLVNKDVAFVEGAYVVRHALMFNYARRSHSSLKKEAARFGMPLSTKDFSIQRLKSQ